ncbi:MAG TPA: hypothetical protein VMT19_00805 [Thermoanaerobaculaceae bacterium]|nr:hypothetical protein [Thermoanaerobaculaceae bacterium]
MRRSAPVFVALGMALANPAAALAASNATSPCVAILVASPEETPKGKFGTTFSATKTSDLTFSVAFEKAFAGEHSLGLRILTPRGFLYQSVTVPVAIGGTGSGTRNVQGYPRSVPVRSGQAFSYKGNTLWKVDVPFPVGGTEIGRNSLYGTWKVLAYVDGSPDPCGAPATFGIGP